MINAIKILLPATLSFIIGILITPIATHYFYKYKMWRKVSRNDNVSDGKFKEIHSGKKEILTPRTGGIIVWMSVVFTVLVVLLIELIFKNELSSKLHFISRGQTLLPFFTLIAGSLVGLGDDFIQIFGKGRWTTDPIILRYIKISVILILGLIIGWWFFTKLGITGIHVPFLGFVNLKFMFIPFFVLVSTSLWSSSVIDGMDGLSGGVLSIIFGSYALIAFLNNQFDIAAFCAVITGATLAFLWFNIPPARFYMGETGMIGLTITLAVIAFMTDTVLLLPIIAFPLFITSLSTTIQILGRRWFNKRVFLLAPLHHHFEAKGWSKYKVTMRYWIAGLMTATIGIIISLIS